MGVAEPHDGIIGRSFGGFVLRERIGEGGFGAVYRAHQPALDRDAVIKVLHARLLESSAASERFLREARIASKLDHPYAAHIYAFGAEPGGELWIAMELVRGTTLDQVLKVQGAIPLERFVPLLDRICEVVHTAHEQGIIHRDLKPANVMVMSRAGRLLPKLLDFGIAKGLTPGTDDLATDATIDTHSGKPSLPPDLGLANTMDTPNLGLTGRGAIMGSPLYMAPEQWVDASSVDGRTDLYALGVLAYECLTGKPPFSGGNITQIAEAHAKQRPPSLGAKFPAALDAVFAKVLAKKPDDRYPGVLAFFAAFREASGIAPEAASLPALDTARRDTAMQNAPQPIAEAVAALDAARNAHQARDAIVQLARTIVRYLGVLALACRGRVPTAEDPAGVAETLRTLYRRALTDKEWLTLAHKLTRVWVERRDAYPLPELVDAFHGERAVARELEALVALRERDATDERGLRDVLERTIPSVSKLLDSLAFLDAYPLVLVVVGGFAERWMGVRRPQRATTTVHGKGLVAGTLAVLDETGTPVLSLAPLLQVAPPTAGAPLELFFVDGRDARGGKLVALASGFEHHDEELWVWLRSQLAGSLEEESTSFAAEKGPYRGLSAFSNEDGGLFFGREKQIDLFVNRLRGQPLLVVVGPSGAGKSSFIYAGVAPALGWRVIAMRPGHAPMTALTARLEHAGVGVVARAELERDRDLLGARLRADAAARGPVLLVIDQLEEIFTLCEDSAQRTAFVDVLAAAARAPEDPVRVVVTLRDDFLVRAEQLSSLRNRIAHGLQLLTVPAADDLVRILVEPARRLGYELEGDLAREMVEEVADQPGALALISFTAAKLWELRDRQFKQLTRTAYTTLGGVGGALAHHAEVTLDAMPAEERALTRTAFRHLVTTQNTRAVLKRAELHQLLGSGEHADAVIEKLIAARLLVASDSDAGGQTIEIVHEALLSAWPRLAEWHHEDVEGARLREQLRVAAAQWHERGRARGLLWRDEALADYTRWRARHPGPLTDVEDAFASASLADAARSRRLRRALFAASLAVLAAGTVVFAGLTAQKKAQADQLHDRLRDQYEDQGRRYVLADDPQRALAYLAKAAELGAHGPAHDFLVASAVRATDGEITEVHHSSTVDTVRFSADGSRLITASNDHTARIWDARTGQLVHTLAHADEVRHASLTADGRVALTASLDGTVVLWDATTGKVRQRLPLDGKPVCAHLSQSGELALTADIAGEVDVWRVADGTRQFHAHLDHGARGCDLANDAGLVAAIDGEGTTWLLEPHDGGRVVPLRQTLPLQLDRFGIDTLAFSPDGSRLATLDGTNAVNVWDTHSGERLHALPHAEQPFSIAFRGDGKRIVTASADHTALVWDAASGAKQLVLAGHTAEVTGAKFSTDGGRIATVSRDGNAWLWDAVTGRVLARWRGHRGALWSVAFDASGSRVATAGDDGLAIVWQASAQERITWLARTSEPFSGAVFANDGSRVLITSFDGIARVFEAGTGTLVVELRGHRGRIWSGAFAPDGGSAVTFGEDGTLRIWDARSGGERAVWNTRSAGKFGNVVWSPDGTSIVLETYDGILRGWEAATGRLRFELPAHDGSPIFTLAVDPTGQRIVTAGDDGTVRIRDLRGNEVARFFDNDVAWSVDVAPNGRSLLTSVKAQKLKIRSIATGLLELQLIDDVGTSQASWAPDGEFVVGAGLDNTARIWDARRGDVLANLGHSGAVYNAVYDHAERQLLVLGPNAVAIHELPPIHPDVDLERLLRCRVPYEVQDDKLRPRDREWRGCR